MKTTAKNIEVLYEDNHLIAINKRAGDIVQGDKTGDTPLSEHVKQFLKEKYNKPGNVFCGVAHRIDRPVTGVTVFAKTSKALSRLNEMFNTREVKKTYWAVVKNKPPLEEMKLVHWLVKDEKTNKSRALKEERPGAKRAELNLSVMAQGDNYTLLEIDPLTGRHHQIRVQLSTLGCSIKGDLKYGAERSNPDGSIHLHARHIQFVHPVSKEKIEITAPVPGEKLWKYFEQSVSL